MKQRIDESYTITGFIRALNMYRGWDWASLSMNELQNNNK